MKIVLIFISALALFSCSKDDDYDRKKAITIFEQVEKNAVDSKLKNIEIKLPAQKNNLAFYGSNQALQSSDRIENFAKNFAFKKNKKISLDISSAFWSFYSGDFDQRFVFSPIIKNNRIFILESSGNLLCYDLTSEKKIWKTRAFPKKFFQNYQTPRIYSASGLIFAISGINQVVALDEVTGKVVWKKTISAIPQSTPISDGSNLFISTNDNKLYSFSVKTGELQWTHSGVFRPTAIFGAADLVIDGDSILVSYSSGEIYAVNKKTGETLWSNSLNISRAVSSDFYLNDIDATPIVKNSVVYVAGNGGLMMAIDAKNGNYLWKRELATITNFWLAEDFLFVISNDNKLLALHAKTGGIKWVSQLPSYANDKKPQTKYIYNGIVMAGDKLLVSRFDGELLIISPFDGKVEKSVNLAKKISHSPIVVNNKIYLYSLNKFTADLVEIE